MADESLYEILGVNDDASGKEIREAHRRLLMKVHPDQGGTDALCRVVQTAYETLADPSARERYDNERRRGRWAPPTSSAGQQSERDASHDDDEWQSAPCAAEDAKSAANVTTGSAWFHARRFMASQPSFLILLLGLLLLCISLAAHVFDFGGWGVLLIALGLNGLWGHRRAVKFDNLRRSAMPQIDAMGGTEFELYLQQLFLAEGYEVCHTGRPGDYGADLLLRRAGILSVVQAKRTTTPVGLDAVREAAVAQAHFGAQHAMVVTNSVFTPSAENLAESNHVALWDRNMLAEFAAKHSAQQPLSGLALWWTEFRLGLPGSLRFTWVAFWLTISVALWLTISAVGLFAESISPPSQRRHRPKRRRR